MDWARQRGVRRVVEVMTCWLNEKVAAGPELPACRPMVADEA